MVGFAIAAVAAYGGLKMLRDARRSRSGIGTEIVIQRFGARRVLAFDLDPRMVNRPKRRLARFAPDRVHLTVGDATAIPARDDAFDAVFDLGAIHHVPDWRTAGA